MGMQRTEGWGGGGVPFKGCAGGFLHGLAAVDLGAEPGGPFDGLCQVHAFSCVELLLHVFS